MRNRLFLTAVLLAALLLALTVIAYGGEVAADADGARALMTASMEDPAAAEDDAWARTLAFLWQTLAT